jgi:enoyl-CoA hydratase
MQQAGLINRLVPAGQALAVARELAGQVSQNAPLALTASKQIMVESENWPAAEAFARQGAITGRVFGSADAMEGAVAFAEKRPPVWRGE